LAQYYGIGAPDDLNFGPDYVNLSISFWVMARRAVGAAIRRSSAIRLGTAAANPGLVVAGQGQRDIKVELKGSKLRDRRDIGGICQVSRRPMPLNILISHDENGLAISTSIGALGPPCPLLADGDINGGGSKPARSSL